MNRWETFGHASAESQTRAEQSITCTLLKHVSMKAGHKG